MAYQFLLLNEDAVMACHAAQIKLMQLGSIDYEELMDEPRSCLARDQPGPLN